MICYEQPEARKPGGLKNTINRIRLPEVCCIHVPRCRKCRPCAIVSGTSLHAMEACFNIKMQSEVKIPNSGYSDLWSKAAALRTNPLRDPPALPVRQQRLDGSGSLKGMISRLFALQGQVFIVV